MNTRVKYINEDRRKEMTQSVGINNSSELLRLQQLEAAQTSGQSALINEEDALVNFSSSYTPATGEAAEADYADAVAALNATSSVSTSGLTKEEIEERLEELKEKREKIEEEMEAIESEIEELAEEAEKNIKAAADKKEQETEEYDEEAQKALRENIQAYIEANKEGGEGMTRDQLQENIKNSLPDKPQLAEAMAALTTANEQVDEIDSLLGDLNSKILEANELDSEMGNLEEEAKEIEEAEEQAAQCCPPPTTCEPQGFQDIEGNQFDFFIDKDGNGDLSNENEFLGYEGGKSGKDAAWAEMTSLDTDGNGTVDANELTAGGVMVYKTGADGSKQALSIEEAFGKDSDLAINTIQHETAKEGVGPNNFFSGTGSENNELWGTFDVTLNGETLNGYQTNDDINWLKDNYNFTDYNTQNSTELENSELEENSNLLNPNEFSEELQPHVNFFNTYTELTEEYRNQINDGYEDLGLTDEEIEGINTSIKAEADEQAQSFYGSLASDKAENAENEDNQTPMTEDEKEEEKKEEELLAA